MYDLGKEAKVTGAFKAFRYQSSLDDEDRRQGERREGGGVDVPRRQRRANLEVGLKSGPNALKPGDEITVTIVPAIDGKSPVGLLSAITYADGHMVRFRSPDE